MKNKYLFRLICSAFILFIAASYNTAAQSDITGQWTATSQKNGGDKINLSFERRTGKNSRSRNSSQYKIEELQGLSRGDTINGNVRFRVVRDAGTVECEGTFTDGKGSGTFRFSPDQGYIDAMRSRGFDFTQIKDGSSDIVEDRLFTAAMLDVKVALADDLISANFGELEVDDLFKASIFKIDGKFMAEMKASGFPNLGMEDLVKARIFKIDADYVRKIHSSGFGTDNFETLVKFSIFKVTPEFLTDLKNEGLNDLDAADIVKLRIFKIDAAFVRSARASEPNITIEKLVEKRLGVRK